MVSVYIQFAKFALVGSINTLIDFGVFSILTGNRFRWPWLKANLTSTTLGLLFSFSANLLFVFQPEDGPIGKRLVLFLLVTGIGLYIIQTGALLLLMSLYEQPLFARLLQHRPFREAVPDRVIIKLQATAVTVVWNFLGYRYLVYS